jgi:cytochrome c oxidase subunit 2
MLKLSAGLAVVLLCHGSPGVAQEGGDLAARGKRLFAEYGCYDCHTMGRVGTPIARDLSGIGSRYPESYLLRWLRDPAAQKPGTHMPKIELTEEEAAALAAYLASLR